jgi:hypothetical protein
MAKTNIIGMIIQIETSKGTAYGLCTHKIERYGSLLYFYPIGTKLSELRDADTQFCCFFPLGAALRQGIVKKINIIEIPSKLKDFPVFRAGLPDPITGKVKNWWFWNGEKEWLVGEINDEQRKMPVRLISNDTMIIERLEEGYTAKDHPL